MIVSGRNVYDAFGRVAKAFYPTTEGTGSKSTFNKSFDNVSPTVTVYDVVLALYLIGTLKDYISYLLPT